MVVSKKFKNLDIALNRNINVPKILYIEQKDIFQNNYEHSLTNFLNQYKANQLFIIRSAVSIEDSKITSYAGFFKSSNKIPYDLVEQTLISTFQQNQQIKICHNLKCEINLIVQEFIPCEAGGVIFTRWKHFFNHFILEISNQGPDKVVSGENSKTFLIDKQNNSFSSKLPTEYSKIVAKLKTEVVNLEKIFDFPMDIEWLYYNYQIYILQIRPITYQPYTLKNASENKIHEIKKQLNKISKGKWYYSSLSESLGCVSPLTFSLFKNLYKSAKSFYNKVGYQAEYNDFMYHLPNGFVLISEEKEKEYFQNSSFFSPFWLSFNKKKLFNEITNYLNDYIKEKSFIFNRLCEIFGYWQICSIYVLFEKQNEIQLSNTDVHEYELSIPGSAKVIFPNFKINNWQKLRSYCKAIFLYELSKIKQQITSDPLLSFSSWNKFTSSNINRTTLTEKYQQLINDSMLNISLIPKQDKPDKKISITKTEPITATAFKVTHPHLFTGKLPKSSILIAPFFLNDWIPSIDKLAGVILENGSYLSHSAIVAREKQIPFFIKVSNAIKIYNSGDTIKLMPNENIIQKITDNDKTE